MQNKLKSIFSETLGISIEEVKDDLQYNSIPEWDSIAHMSLIAAIDDEFDIMLDTEDVIDISSFTEAKRILSKYGVEFE